MAYHKGDISSARAAFLIAKGYGTGTDKKGTNEMLLAWLQNNGATAKDLNGAWIQFFAANGGTSGTFSDRAYAYLIAVTGLQAAAASHALSDLWREYWAGSYGPP